MKQYLTMVISGTVLATIFQTISPERWKKYINAVTGIMIVSLILTPLFKLKNINFFYEYSNVEPIYSDIHNNLVCLELETKISEDASSKIKELTNKDIKVETTILVNDNLEIIGIKEMKVWSSEHNLQIKKLLTEVYSPQKISFR